MTVEAQTTLRLQFLARAVRKESWQLKTDNRAFPNKAGT